MPSFIAVLLLSIQLQPTPLGEEVETTLRGSPASMERQHRVAVEGGYTFVGTLEEMELLAAEGHLVEVPGGPDYEVMDWVFPYALPEVRRFVEYFAARYRQACGEPLVVTSLTRPFSEQPRNAHQLSVHPAGMAVDLRISQTPACRQYLEASLLEMEDAGLLDITRERAPPHYHIAIFPETFTAYAGAFLPAPERRAQPRDGRGGSGEGRGVSAILLIVAILAGAVAAFGIRAAASRRGGASPGG
jgi:hypothetical protein